MKKRIPIVLLSILSLMVFARAIRPWTEDEMRNASDLIMVGTVAKVTDLDETNTTLWYGFEFRGVETTFNVSKVLKGKISDHEIVLHHYRFTKYTPKNGPSFLNLVVNATNQYLLYLAKDGTNRFAPVSGQIDPAVDAVKELSEK